jgi:hypothetical protein
MNKSLLSALGLTLAVAFAAPATAATTTPAQPMKTMHTYYVGKVVKTKKCEVTTHKPDGKTVMMVGKDTYKTKAEAETAMKAAAECKG